MILYHLIKFNRYPTPPEELGIYDIPPYVLGWATWLENCAA